MKKHFKIQVFGKVQGVWYRASTQRKAEELGVQGFVRNQADGSVYVEAEGDVKALQALIDWCYEGPPGARVERVDQSEGEWKGFEGFQIKRG